MKFTCSHQTWVRGINAVQNAVGSPISNPIVENIHVSCEEDKVRFLATNLNLTIRCVGEAQVQEMGQIVLPTKVISSVVRDLPAGEVVFQEKEGTIRLKCMEFSARLKGQPGEQFPAFIGVEAGMDISIRVDKLKEVIRKTTFATSQEKSRYELDGVKFDLKESGLHFISTDGRRLSMYTYRSESMPSGPLSVLVPTRTLQEVSHSLPDEGEVNIRLQERKVQFTCGDTTVISNLLTDNFPQYEKIVPSGGQIKVIFNREELLTAVKRASNLSSLETSMLIFRFEPNEVEVYGERTEVGGEGRDKISVEYSGEKMEIRYNHRFMTDFLRVLDEEKVELEIIDPTKPGIYRGIGNPSFLYVLMPMKPPENEPIASE